MKKYIAFSLIFGLLVTSVSNVSSVFGQFEIVVHGKKIICESDSTDKNCISAITARIETAYCNNQSSICGTAPKEFTALLNFVREINNSIKTIGTQGEYLGQYINPNRFAGNTFTPPQKTAVGKVTRNVLQKAKFTLATTAIFSSPVNFAGLKDMLGGVVLLSKNKVFLRDNKIVEQLESDVNDKKYELGLGGGWYEQVNAANRAVMQNIIDSYIAQGILLPGSKVNDGVLYNNITSMLTRILSALKSFLYFGSPNQLNEITRGGADQGIVIKFNDVALKTITREYECARGPNYICSSESKKFKDMWKTMRKSLSLGSVSTKKTFNDAVTRLGDLFSKHPSDDFKSREADLLRSMYGTQKVNKGLLFGNLGKATSDVGQQITDLGSDINTFRSFPPNLEGTVERVKKVASVTSSVSAEQPIKVIDSYLRDVFDSQETDKDLASMTEVKDITPAFKVLGQQISVIKNDILGGKEKDNSLLKSLGVACELQCGRGGLCR